MGRSAEPANDEIQLSGLNILPVHGYITRHEKTSEVILRPANGGQIRVNGRIIEENPEADGVNDVNGVVLSHNDRVMFGLHHLFLFKFAGVEDGPETTKITSYRYAQREIAAAEGYGVGDSGLSNVLVETISEVLAAVQEANAITEEFMVPKRYVLVINKQDEQDSDIRGLVSIKVKDFAKHNKWIMSKSQFMAAHELMKDMYVAYVEGGGLRALTNWPKDKNPFEIPCQDWLIGGGKATFRNLTSVMKIKESILLQNVKGANEGILKFQVVLKLEGVNDILASSIAGSLDKLSELDEKLKVEITTESIQGLRWTKGPVYCKFNIEGLEKSGFKSADLMHETKAILSNNPKFNDVHEFEPNPKAKPKVSQSDLLDKLGKMQLSYEVYGKYDEDHMKTMYGSTLGVEDAPGQRGRRMTVSKINGIHSPQSIEAIEIRRQETREEVEVFLSVIERQDLKFDQKKELLNEQIAKFKHTLQLNSEILKSDELSLSAEEALEGLNGAGTLQFISQIEALVYQAKTDEDINKISERAVKELDYAEEGPSNPEVENRVRNRRKAEGFICSLRDLKEDEDHFKGFALEILDKCSNEEELLSFKKQIALANSVFVANMFSLKMSAPEMTMKVVESVEKRHSIGRETVAALSKWTEDPKLLEAYVAFPNLPANVQQIKKDIAMLLMQKSQAVQDQLRKTESILMGEVSRNIERGAFHYDEDDKELVKNRKQLEMLKSNKKAIVNTVDALSQAQERMNEQSNRMEALKTIVNQQASKGAQLEKVSQDQSKELTNLRQELERLQTVLRTREQEHLTESKVLGEQLHEKSNQLGKELLVSAKLRESLTEQKAELEKLKVMLASAERVNEILKGSGADQKLLDMADEKKKGDAELANLQRQVSELGSKVKYDEYTAAMKNLTIELAKLEKNRQALAQATASSAAQKDKGGDGKVHPEGVESEAPVKGKKGACTIL